jgi:hypothetical protein
VAKRVSPPPSENPTRPVGRHRSGHSLSLSLKGIAGSRPSGRSLSGKCDRRAGGAVRGRRTAEFGRQQQPGRLASQRARTPVVRRHEVGQPRSERRFCSRGGAALCGESVGSRQPPPVVGIAQIWRSASTGGRLCQVRLPLPGGGEGRGRSRRTCASRPTGKPDQRGGRLALIETKQSPSFRAHSRSLGVVV